MNHQYKLHCHQKQKDTVLQSYSYHAWIITALPCKWTSLINMLQPTSIGCFTWRQAEALIDVCQSAILVGLVHSNWLLSNGASWVNCLRLAHGLSSISASTIVYRSITYYWHNLWGRHSYGVICLPQTLLWHIPDFPDNQPACSRSPCFFKLRIWKISSRNRKDAGMSGWNYLLANSIHKESQYYWLTKCMNKNQNINGYFTQPLSSHSAWTRTTT